MTTPDNTNHPTPGSADGFRAPEALVSGMILGVVGLAILALVVSDTGLEWTWEYWGDSDGKFDRSVIFRNFGLLILAAIALPLAIWRSWTAHKQVKTAESGLIIDRYQKGAQMLESSELSVRIAGVYALRELASSDPEETYFLVLDILYALVREKSKVRIPLVKWHSRGIAKVEYGEFPADLQSALAATSLVRRLPTGATFETHRDWSANLTKANLSGVNLQDANLSGAHLLRANLSSAELQDANLSGAHLLRANLSDALLPFANLSGARLLHANLSGVFLRDANLSGANLRNANLFRANLREANLSGARLLRANLSGARLPDAILSGALLRDTNLSRANLRGANLSGARLGNANLSGARLQDTKLDEQTNTKGTWAFETDPPRYMPERIKEAIAYRKAEEDWDRFVDRIRRERPELGW